MRFCPPPRMADPSPRVQAPCRIAEPRLETCYHTFMHAGLLVSIRTLRAIVLVSMTLACFAAAEADSRAATPNGDSFRFRCAAGESFPLLAKTGAWNWCQDPKAISIDAPEPRTYAGWVDGAGNVVATCYEHASGNQTTQVLHDSLEVDDHDNPAFLVWPDGRLSTFYTPHGGARRSAAEPAMYVKTTAFPNEFTYWLPEHRLQTNTEGSWGWTYPNVCWLADEGPCGRAYLFWRGGSGGPAVSYSIDGDDWSQALPLLAGAGTRPYLKAASDDVDTIHLALTDGHPRGEPHNCIYYVCYEAGSFFRADGTPVRRLDQLPMAVTELDLVYDAAKEGAPAWIWDIAQDAEGYPVIAFTTFPSPQDHRYQYAVWNGTEWIRSEICPAGSWVVAVDDSLPDAREELWYSGGIALDHSDPRVVYLSRPVAGIYEIERWTTCDSGSTWIAEPVTCGSALDNTRPCVPRGHLLGGPDVLWLSGEYRHYREFETSVRMRILE